MKTSLRILNLEDNVNDAELNESMLAARWPNCVLMRADNQKDFCAGLKQENLDLILSDYSMPNFNGLKALTLARERRAEIPFVFVSGTIGEDAAIEALKNGATDYVLKNRLARLIPVVERALREFQEDVECKQAQEAIRHSEHKYRELFESLSDAAFLVDEESEKIIDANRRAGTLLGATRAEILGRKEFLALDKIGKNSIAVEYKMLRADGRDVPVKVHTSWLTLYGRTMALWLCRELPDRTLQPIPARKLSITSSPPPAYF
jgi:CheY-like chemotaxis protein